MDVLFELSLIAGTEHPVDIHVLMEMARALGMQFLFDHQVSGNTGRLGKVCLSLNTHIGLQQRVLPNAHPVLKDSLAIHAQSRLASLDLGVHVDGIEEGSPAFLSEFTLDL